MVVKASNGLDTSIEPRLAARQAGAIPVILPALKLYFELATYNNKKAIKTVEYLVFNDSTGRKSFQEK